MRCERESTKPIASPPPIRKNLWQWKPKIAAIQELKKPNWTVDSGVALFKPAAAARLGCEKFARHSCPYLLSRNGGETAESSIVIILLAASV
jgi:hypothetical protein